jgi:hypothetical protein
VVPKLEEEEGDELESDSMGSDDEDLQLEKTNKYLDSLLLELGSIL